jgi:hypothetical protein
LSTHNCGIVFLLPSCLPACLPTGLPAAGLLPPCLPACLPDAAPGIPAAKDLHDAAVEKYIADMNAPKV